MKINSDTQKNIIIRFNKKLKGFPSELAFSKTGEFYLDGEIYDSQNPKYSNISLNRQSFINVDTGEETQKMIEEAKKYKKGDTVVFKDVDEPQKKEKTIVTF